MKIAVATKAGGPLDLAENDFGRAETYTIFRLHRGKVRVGVVVKNPYLNFDRWAVRQEARLLKSLGVDVVLAGRFGLSHALALEEAGVRMFHVPSVSAIRAAAFYVQGLLEPHLTAHGHETPALSA